ncbi:MAG: M28 family peptidase [Myxococcota bacterium]
MPRSRFVLAACAGLLLACATAPPPPPPAPTPIGFSAPRAWEHLEALVEIGPRVPGTEGASRARAYVRQVLEGLGIEVLEQQLALEDRGDGEPLEVHNLVGVLPGESRDVFVLAAALDTRHFETFDHAGANRASGAALLLELAALFARDPLPYTVRLVFLGAEVPQAELLPRQALWGSRLLVNELEDEGILDRARLAVFFGQVADAELTIARDLGSHRVYRDAFFKAARRMGHENEFPQSAGFDSVDSGHSVFFAARVRRAVVISDPRYGGEEPPGIYHHTEQDGLERLSPESLQVVGEVSEQAIRDIAALLTRVDRFARRRSVGEVDPAPEEIALPPAGEAPEAGPPDDVPEAGAEAPGTDLSAGESSAEPPADPPAGGADGSPTPEGASPGSPDADEAAPAEPSDAGTAGDA